MSEPQHLSSFTLDALALGALAGAEAEAARAHLVGCEACARALRATQAAGEDFRAGVMPRTLARVHERTARPPWLVRWALLPVPALAAAALLLVLWRGGGGSPVDGPALASKGSATLRVFANHDGHVFQVHDGTPLAPGDQIRFVVEPADLPYLIVASVDGTGKPTVYYPYDAAASGRLERSISLELPGSIVLDAAPGPERLFALFSRTPVDATVLRSALAAVGRMGPDAIRSRQTLPVAAQAQASVYFEKVNP